MEYTKIKVADPYYPKRFYRILAIEGNPDLYTLGTIIGYSVNAWFEHLFLFDTKDFSFVPDMWMDDPWNDNCMPMSKYHLSDLGNTFKYEYDTGESYSFDCTVYKRKYKTDNISYEGAYGFVIEGKGQGIFENDHNTLNRYLAGYIDSNDGEKEGQFLPMNMEFETFGDFDKDLDLDELIWYPEEIEEITDQFKLNYDISSDIQESEQSAFIALLINQIAGDIFNDEFTNSIFRRLIKKYDINDAYHMIVDATIQLLDDDLIEVDEEAFKLAYQEKLKELK